MRSLEPRCTQLRPLAAYVDVLPSSRPGKRLNRATLWRWAGRGVRGIRLHTIKLGGGRYTCDAWISEFIRSQSEDLSELEEPAVPGEERSRIMTRFGLSAEQTG